MNTQTPFTELRYVDLEEDLRKTFERTGVSKKCYNGNLAIGGSWWGIRHPNGSIAITFWLMEKVPTDRLIKTAKAWAKKHGLIAATFYPNGIKDNLDPRRTQDWNNKAAQNSKFIYGFTFYSDRYELASIFKPI
jgi:hypothetical protein